MTSTFTTDNNGSPVVTPCTGQSPYSGYGIAGNGTILFTTKLVIDPMELCYVFEGPVDAFKNDQELGTGTVNNIGSYVFVFQNNADGDFIAQTDTMSSSTEYSYSINNTTLDFLPSALSNRMTINGTTKNYVVGMNSPGEKVWWDGVDHTGLIDYSVGYFSGSYVSVNAATATIKDASGSLVTKPAIQILDDQELWEMDPASGTVNPPLGTLFLILVVGMLLRQPIR